MPICFESLTGLLQHGYDAVIDVRSPSEFDEDHMPGAISLPVLDDAERAKVGTIYKQENPFKARKIGAALVVRNAADHIEHTLAHHDRDWRPLVYCWRGGQRSGTFAWLLREIGWRADVVQGGYRSYRRLVNAALHKTPLPHRLILLDGQTGTAKTDVLTRAAGLGAQVLDLERLARHRGSLLGDGPEPQPSQKAFESAIAGTLAGFDTARPVLVEAESSKIGRLNVPPMLWSAMCQAPCIEVSAPLPAREAYLTVAYRDILSDPEKLRSRLSHLRAIRGGALVDHWMDLIANDDKPALTQHLITDHYDPAYSRGRKRNARTCIARIPLDSLAPDDLDQAALDLTEHLRQPFAS